MKFYNNIYTSDFMQIAATSNQDLFKFPYLHLLFWLHSWCMCELWTKWIRAKVCEIFEILKKKIIILYPLTGWAARHCGLSIPWIIEVFKEPSRRATLICVSSNSELIQYKLRETQSTASPLILWISVKQERENYKWMRFLILLAFQVIFYLGENLIYTLIC